jgi:hypothetical protein
MNDPSNRRVPLAHRVETMLGGQLARRVSAGRRVWPRGRASRSRLARGGSVACLAHAAWSRHDNRPCGLDSRRRDSLLGEPLGRAFDRTNRRQVAPWHVTHIPANCAAPWSNESFAGGTAAPWRAWYSMDRVLATPSTRSATRIERNRAHIRRSGPHQSGCSDEKNRRTENDCDYYRASRAGHEDILSGE